jgi:hypothetical protein
MSRRLPQSAGAALLLGLLAAATELSAQAGFTPGKRTLFSLDLTGTAVGEMPKGIRLLSGSLDVVDKDGVRMLKSSGPVECSRPAYRTRRCTSFT